VPHFENGQVWISPYWSARSGYYIDRGLPFEMVIPEEGVIGLLDVACIPVGAKNKKLAYEFLNWRLDPAVQRAWALAYFSSPTRSGVELPAKFAASQIVTKEQMAKTLAEAKTKLAEAKDAGADAWQNNVKPALDAALDKAQKLYEDAAARFCSK